MPSPSASASAGRKVSTARVDPINKAAAPAAAAARTTWRERSTEPSKLDWARRLYGAYFTVFEAMRQPLRLPLGLSSLPPTGAASLADDFAERHAPVDLRDLDLDLVPDLRPRDEDHEVRDPRESVAFPTDIFDLGLVHLPFLHRDVRRSEARPRIRHPRLHAAAPCHRHFSHPLHGI